MWRLPNIGAVDVRNRASAIEEAHVPPGVPLVVQISRWDRLKDHVGVLRGFARHVRRGLDAHLLLVGPAAASVADDPRAPRSSQRSSWRGVGCRPDNAQPSTY